ncbi:MAG: CBS domain-containing protein [Magnetococcus sp. XQGC-1]
MREKISSEACRQQLTLDDFSRALQERETFKTVIRAEDLLSLYQSAKAYAQIRCIEQVMVEQVMTQEVVTIAPTLSLAEAAELMLQHRISGLPVVEENVRLVGILAEADLLKAVGIPCHHPARTLWETLESLFLHHANLQGFRGIVQEHMTTPVITVPQGSSLEQAVSVMKKRQIKRLLVVDTDGILHGVITRSDILRLFLAQAK